MTGSREAGIEFTTPDWDFFTFKDKYMNFVTVDADKDRALAATSTYAHPIDLRVFLPGKWGISAVPGCFEATESDLTTSIAALNNPAFAGLVYYPYRLGPPKYPTDELLDLDIPPNLDDVQTEYAEAIFDNDGLGGVASLYLKDLGDYKFSLWFNDYCQSGTIDSSPVYEDADSGVLKLQTGDSNPAAEFTMDYKGYYCGSGDDETCTKSDLNLQQGEVAVFSECNYKAPAIVFGADVGDFSIYDQLTSNTPKGYVYGIQSNQVASVMVGPDTFVELGGGGGLGVGPS